MAHEEKLDYSELYCDDDCVRFVESGNLYTSQSLYSKAISAYTTALTMNPNDSIKANIFASRAFCYTKLDLLYNARNDLDFALTLDPINVTTNSINQFQEHAYSKQTIPAKVQNTLAALSSDANITSINQVSEFSSGIIGPEENRAYYYNQRGIAYGQIKQYKPGLSDLINARKYDDDPKLLPLIAYYAVMSRRYSLAEQIMNACDDRGIDASLPRGIVALNHFKFASAVRYFSGNNSKPGVTLDPECYMQLANIYISFGHIRKALEAICMVKNDPNALVIKHALMILAIPELPKYVDGKTQSAVMLNWFIYGLYHSLTENIESIPLHFYIGRDEFTWAYTLGMPIPPLPKVPEGFSSEIKNPEDAALLFELAHGIGSCVTNPCHNYREKVCMGMGIIQLVQMLTDPMSVNLDRAAGAISHWLQLIDPMQHFYWRELLPLAIYFHRGPFDTTLKCYSASVFELLKSRLKQCVQGQYVVNERTIADEINVARTPDEFIATSKMSLDIPMSPTVSIFITPDAEGFRFGLRVARVQQSGIDAVKLRMSWDSLMVMLGDDKVSKERTSEFIERAVEFLFNWLFASPLESGSEIVGACLFRAVVWSYFDKDVVGEMPAPTIMQVDALLTNFAPLFQMYMLPHIKLKHDGHEGITDLPLVTDVFPTMMHRIRALGELPEEPIPEEADPRPYLTPIYCSGLFPSQAEFPEDEDPPLPESVEEIDL